MNSDANAAFLSPLVAVAIATFLVVAPPAHGSSGNSAGDVMITNNPDGTFTIQKTPQKGTCGHSKGKNGLVIPPQVVVPLVPAGGRPRIGNKRPVS
jgi:hypothetical protein